MVDTPSVRGAKALTGTPYVIVDQGDVSVPVPLGTLTSSPTGAVAYLAARGVFLMGKLKTDQFIKSVGWITKFPETNIADRFGWNEDHFVLSDGTAVSPKSNNQLIVAVEGRSDTCAVAGTLKGWKRGVAQPLTGQSLGMFLLIMPFMSPLLALSSQVDSFGFELVGKEGVGKSTLQQLAASVLGHPVQSTGPAYQASWGAVLNNVDEHLDATGDMLLILDGAALAFADEAKAKRSSAFKAFAHKATGQSGRRGATPGKAAQRSSYLSTSRVPLTELIGSQSEVAAAVSDRLITLTVPPDRPFGVFDSLPDDRKDSSEFARALLHAAREHHGVPMRRFLHRLVKFRATDEAQLRQEIDRRIAQFRRFAQVDANNGSAVRVANAFGLVYAAGALAKQFKVLPKEFDCGPAVLDCYQHYRSGSARLPFAERLQEIAARPDTAIISREKRGLSKKKLRAAFAIVKERRDGRWLAVRPKHMLLLFPDWRLIHRAAEVRGLLKSEGGRQQSWFQLRRKGDRDRVFLFRLPEALIAEPSDGG